MTRRSRGSACTCLSWQRSAIGSALLHTAAAFAPGLGSVVRVLSQGSIAAGSDRTLCAHDIYSGGVWATWARRASSRFGALAHCSLREAHRASGAKIEPKHSSITATACAARALFRTAQAPENGYRFLLRRTAGHRHCMRNTPRAQYSTRRRTPHRTPCSSVFVPCLASSRWSLTAPTCWESVSCHSEA